MQQSGQEPVFDHSSTLCIAANNLTLPYKVFLEMFFFQYSMKLFEQIKKLLTLFENVIAMFFQHIKTIIIFTLSKIKNNSSLSVLGNIFFSFTISTINEKHQVITMQELLIFFECLIMRTKHTKD